MERDRTQLLVQTMKELNTQYNIYNRRASNTPPLAVNRVKVTFKDEPGEGSGVTRSFYTAFAEVEAKCDISLSRTIICKVSALIIIIIFFKALLANEKLPNLEAAQVGSKYTQYNVLQKLKSRDRDRDLRRQVCVASTESRHRSLFLITSLTRALLLLLEYTILWEMS